MGLFDKVFKKKVSDKNLAYMQFMNGYVPSFSTWTSRAYQSDIVRSVIDCIARNGAKFKGRHIRRSKGRVEELNTNLNRILQYQWNPIMNAYAALYKVISELYDPASNNALIYIQTDDKGNVLGLYPLKFGNAQFLEDYEGNIYMRYQFNNGRKVTVPYENVAHLRMYFKEDDVFGTSSDTVLRPTLQLIKTSDEGIINAVKSSAYLRGILKFTGVLKPEDIKNERDRFVAEYLSTENNGGIGALDSKATFEKTQLDPKIVDAEQMKLIEEKVYKFFNINENIVKSQYTEDEWNAFYESVLEPIALQLSLELTNKIFTETERGFGNEIIFEANRLQYVSVKTKVQLVKETAPFAILTRNEIREIFNMAPVEGGDTFVLAVGGKA
ncbi:MAG TPA: phage portal protein, partial [Bacteroidia bacterium]